MNSLDITKLINTETLAALITEAAKQAAHDAAPRITPISDLIQFTTPDGNTTARRANLPALRKMAAVYNSSRADLPR